MPGDDAHPPPPGWSPPPPGWQPPPAPPTGGWGQPGAPPYPPALPPRVMGAAHKPGAIPLRPLGLGDIYDAAFRIIRFNPQATVGSAVLVAAGSMALPLLVVAGLTVGFDLTASDSADGSTGEALAAVGTLGSLLLGSVLQWFGLIFVTGMVAQVVAAAAVGRRLSLGEAWAATRGSRWRLVGLSLVLGLASLGLLAVYVGLWVVVVLVAPTAVIVVFGVVTLPAFVALNFWWWIRVYYLPAPALMIERTGVFAAIGRGFRLTRRQFWRTFGIALLTLVITLIAGYFLSLPFTIASQVVGVVLPESQYVALLTVVFAALGTVAQTAFVAPFSAAVATTQYLDQRIRKEAYDVELMSRAGLS